MKVKITKTVKWCFDHSIEWFEAGEIRDIAEYKAQRLMETGYAVKAETETKKPEVEQKMQQPQENKAVDLTKVENKTFTNKRRGRPKKGA